MALRTPLSVTPHLYMGDSTGRPLDKGVVYFGEQDKDPEFYPIDLFSDDALTKPLAQPVHTKGGYLYDKGDMVEPHAKELIYSVKVLDSYGRKVFYKGAMMRNSWNDDVIEQINTAIIGSADAARQVAIDITNDAINNTAIEGSVLADTFVVVDGDQSLRDVNQKTARTYQTAAIMQMDTKLKVGQFAKTQNFSAIGDRGGRTFTISDVAGTLSIPLSNGLHAIPSLGHEITSTDLGIPLGAKVSSSILLNIPLGTTKLTLYDCHLETDAFTDVVGVGSLEIVGINSKISDAFRPIDPKEGEAGSAAAFNGIRFDGFDRVVFKDVAVVGAITTARKPISALAAKTQHPAIEFFRCKEVYFSCPIEAQMPSYAALTEAETTYEVMGCFPIVFYKCDYVSTSGTVVTNKVSGEVIGAVQCGVVDFVNVRHAQGAGTTYWSLAKLIDCASVTMDDVFVQSTSTGSVVDILAETVVIGSGNRIDAVGKHYDITSEWTTSSIKGCENVHIAANTYRPTTTSGSTYIFNSYHGLGGYTPLRHKNMSVESIIKPQQTPAKSAVLLKLPYTDNVTIGLIDAWDVDRILATRDLETGTDFKSTTTIKTLKLNRTAGSVIPTTFDMAGAFMIESGEVNNSLLKILNLKKEATFKEAYDAGYTTKIIGVEFNHTEVQLSSNTDFYNCTFNQSTFRRLTESAPHRIRFYNCSIKYASSTESFFTGIGEIAGVEQLILFKDCAVKITSGTLYGMSMLSQTVFDGGEVDFMGSGIQSRANGLTFRNTVIGGTIVGGAHNTVTENTISIINSTVKAGSVFTIQSPKIKVNLYGNGLPLGYDAEIETPNVAVANKSGNYTI